MKTFILARRSKEKDEKKGLSIPAQISEQKDQLARIDPDAEPEIVEESNVSGWKAPLSNRPEFLRVCQEIEDAKEGTIRLMVSDQDRLTRNSGDTDYLWDLFERRQVELWIEMRQVNYEDDYDFQKFWEQAGRNDAFVRRLSRNMKRKLKQTARDNPYIFLGGCPAYGFTTKEIETKHIMKSEGLGKDEAAVKAKRKYPKDQTVYVDKEAAKYLRKMSRFLLVDGLMLAQIRDWLNDREVACPLAKRWSTTTVKSALTSSWLYGQRTYNKTTHVKRKKENIRVHNPPEEWIHMECPTIFDEATVNEHRRVIETLPNHRKMAGHKKHTWPLGNGMLKCGLCGSSFNGNRRQVKDPDRQREYRCNTRYHNPEGNCPARPVDARWAEAHVLSQLYYYLTTPDALERAYSEYQKSLRPSQEEAKAILADSQERLKDNEEKRDRAVSLLLEMEDSDIDPAALRNEYERIERLHTELEEAVLQAEADVHSVRMPRLDADQFSDKYIDRMRRALKSGNLEKLKEIIQRHVAQVHYHPAVDEKLLSQLDKKQQEHILARANLGRQLVEEEVMDLLVERGFGWIVDTRIDLTQSPFEITWRFEIASPESPSITAQAPPTRN